MNLLTFRKEFILPLLEVNKNGRIPIFVKDDYIYSMVKGAGENILYTTYTPVSITDPVDRFNINLLKLQNGISCIVSDNFSELVIKNNYLEYQDKDIKFNIKLLATNMISDCPKITPDNIAKHPIEGTISIPSDKLKEIIKAKNFASESNKFYIEQSGDDAILEFGDREIDHKDNIRITIAGTCSGNINPCVFETSIFDLIQKSKGDILLKVGQRALIIELSHENSTQTYLTTKLKK